MARPLFPATLFKEILSMHRRGNLFKIFLAVVVLMTLTVSMVPALPVTHGIQPSGGTMHTVSGTVYYSGTQTGPVSIEAFTPMVNGTFDSLGMTTIEHPGPYSITLPEGNCWMFAWIDVVGNPVGPAPQGSPVNRSLKFRPDTIAVTSDLKNIDITLYEIPVTDDAVFQIIDNRLSRSRNDSLMHGAQSQPLETGTSLHILNPDNEGFLILDTMTVAVEGSHIAHVSDNNLAVWDSDHILWTYPDRYAIAPHNTMDFGWKTDIFVPGSIPFSLNRQVNRSVFSAPGYQLLTFNTSFDSMNCDWIYGSISAAPGEAPVNITLLRNTFVTDAPVESVHPDTEQALGFNLNRALLQAGHTYTFSVILFVDPSKAHGLPMTYKPQVMMVQGFTLQHRSGTPDSTATMPDALLPEYVTHATITNYFPRNWSYSASSARQMVLEEVIQAASLPNAGFTANRTLGSVPLAVQFTDTSTGSPTTWNWSFGDGSSSSARHPVKTYTSAGTYTVSLLVTNADGSNKSVMADYISAYPPVVSLPGYVALPTDPDGDGICEDLNGNTRLDFADVVLYFNQMEWIAAHEPVRAFDLNGNGRIDFADIVRLFGEI